MSKPFQRVGSKSNAHVGREFEQSAKEYFKSVGIELVANVQIPVGVDSKTKIHAFDLGCNETNIIVECKLHRWTDGGNVPSAKLRVWNEAILYFMAAPNKYRKIMFVLKDYSSKRRETLAQYYLRTYYHLVPSDVEFWEYDETNSTAVQIGI